MPNKKYPDEIKERAVRLVLAAQNKAGGRRGACTRVAHQLGIAPDTLRKWVPQAQIDQGLRPGVTSDTATRIVELERENRELQRAKRDLEKRVGFLRVNVIIGALAGLAHFFAAPFRR